jgi:hypothetical protein
MSMCPSRQVGRVEPEEMAAARQGLGKLLTAATNTHPTIEELLDAVISMRSVSYQILRYKETKVGVQSSD